MKDNRGTEIEVGQTVCFNYQGQVALGVVEKIIPRERNYGGTMRGDGHNFHVNRLYPNPKVGKTGRSIVRHPENLMVIFEK